MMTINDDGGGKAFSIMNINNNNKKFFNNVKSMDINENVGKTITTSTIQSSTNSSSQIQQTKSTMDRIGESMKNVLLSPITLGQQMPADQIGNLIQ